MGGKRRLLKQLLPLFPKDINTLYDLFAGGGTISLNTKAGRYVWNDLNKPLINMYEELAKLDETELKAISESSKKLESKEEFLKLREQYNSSEKRSAIELYQLTLASFNGLARFNQQGHYNMPWSSPKRLTDHYFETKNKQLIIYNQWARTHNVSFIAKSYVDLIKNTKFNSDDFLYFDPPYRITTAVYNDGNRGQGWLKQDDEQLVDILNDLNSQHIKWGMSNALTSRGKTNQILTDWLNKYLNYRVYHLNMNYSNSTYHTKAGVTDEVYVTNY